MTNNILRFWRKGSSDDPMEPLFSAAPILMHSIDSKGILMRVSQFWADKLGYKVEEMVGRPSSEFLTEASRTFAVEVALPQFFKDGSAYNVEYEFVRKDGGTIPVLMSALAQYDEDGAFVRSLAIVFDNSEAKRSAAELGQKQRMEAIGSLVGGVAHDFNNLLAVVQGNLEFLKADPDDPDRLDFIESAVNAAQRGAILTQQLLSYGRKAHLSPKVVDLNETVRAADRMVSRLLPANIRLETVTGAGLWQANVDASLLETAILNIVNNARDAVLPDGGRITIETGNVRIDQSYVDSRAEEVAPGRYVMLAISDTGIGMDEATLAQVFDPFFTTKPIGAGSGLGLSMVFGFMRQSGGAIRAYSEVDTGTTFRLYFPAVNGDDDSGDGHGASGAASGHEPDGRGKLILLAEDEADVRKVLVRQLRDANFAVVDCASGDEALRHLLDGVRPDILVTDIVMPGSIQGPELAQRARAMLVDLRALFISGYPTEAAIHGNGLRTQDRHLVKPVGRDALIQALREMTEEET